MMTKPNPPMVTGLPILGNMVEFMRDKIKFVERGYQQHGEIFAFNLAGQNMAMLLGPEHAETFFKLTDAELSIQDSMTFLLPVIGKVGILGGMERYMEERKIIAPLLGGRHMKAHIEAMTTELDVWMQEAGASGEVDINHFSEEISLRVAARALLGDNFRDMVGEEFISLFHDLANGVDQVLPYNLPLPRFRKRDKARAKLSDLMGSLVDERRANPDAYDDFLQYIVNAELADGSQFDKERIISLILLMVFAGFDTTSAHLAWGFVYLLENPDLLERAKMEVDAVFAETDTIELAHIRQMPHINYAMLEVERIRPAVQVLIRSVVEDVEIGDYLIPAGWSVMISPEFSHKLERVFTNPDEFDPQRFNDERCEHAQHSNSLTGFGGGLHKCWGMKFAYNEMATIIATMLHHYDLDLSNTPVEDSWIAGIIRPDVKLQYRQRVAEPVL